ncbi:MAG: hypothetical protein AAB901_00785, partial [Patescibacteria group bacterium]
MTRTHTQDEQETGGSKIFVRRNPITIEPFEGTYRPSDRINDWERRGKVLTTPSFRRCILAESGRPDSVPNSIRVSVDELSKRAISSR